ncbi:hypothetical protein K32_04130 [Kaistia sp. 32K]|uniref:hypothetical protein n=1 Tax=Kaistia sp. 32K TaxID=2795690 RepID=UPI001915B3DD|nr:hypothetical protein [Kaistia sp. 32K]BCP51796.1 hypothetical protein K32_04130 [Kaistia sp. 32K]
MTQRPAGERPGDPGPDPPRRPPPDAKRPSRRAAAWNLALKGPGEATQEPEAEKD